MGRTEYFRGYLAAFIRYYQLWLLKWCVLHLCVKKNVTQDLVQPGSMQKVQIESPERWSTLSKFYQTWTLFYFLQWCGTLTQTRVAPEPAPGSASTTSVFVIMSTYFYSVGLKPTLENADLHQSMQYLSYMVNVFLEFVVIIRFISQFWF